MSSRHNRSTASTYFLKSLCFLIILLAITIVTVFIAIKPVTSLVHKIEEHYPKQVSDIVLNDDTYQPMSASSYDEVKHNYGDKVANISSDDFALNSSVYYGSNRVSIMGGCGFNSSSAMFNQGATTVLVGYEEGELSPLDYANSGDTITVTTNYGSFNYQISDVSYSNKPVDDYLNIGENKLVICALTSDFSSHSGQSLYVVADLVGEVQ